MNMKLDEFKPEIKYDNKTTFKFLYIKLSALTSNKPPSFYEQPSSDLIQLPLLKSHLKSSHSSQFTKHLSSMILEGETHFFIFKNGGMP